MEMLYNFRIKDAEYDALTMSFGIRNVPDVSASMREMYRVLGEGGKALILEFSLPKIHLYDLVTCFICAICCHWLVGSSRVIMRPISISIRVLKHFHMEMTFCILMRNAGFETVKAHPVTFGIATIYEACKQPVNQNI